MCCSKGNELIRNTQVIALEDRLAKHEQNTKAATDRLTAAKVICCQEMSMLSYDRASPMTVRIQVRSCGKRFTSTTALQVDNKEMQRALDKKADLKMMERRCCGTSLENMQPTATIFGRLDSKADLEYTAAALKLKVVTSLFVCGLDCSRCCSAP